MKFQFYRHINKTVYPLLIVICLFVNQAMAQFTVVSPDKKVEIKVSVGESISYSVFFNGKTVLLESPIGFEFKKSPPLGADMKVVHAEPTEIKETWKPVLKRKSEVLNHCNQLKLLLVETRFPSRKINLTFRAYNDGIAFRTEFLGKQKAHQFTITDETTSFIFPGDISCWAANHKGYGSHQENEYFERKLSDLKDEWVIGLPMTAKIDEQCYVAITEANLTDFAGMYLKTVSEKNKIGVKAQLAPMPGQNENDDKVTLKLPHKTPWRVLMIGETPGDLVESEIITNLNEPCAIEDPSWIKPGISAWDHWWSGRVKMDTETINKYIDLASDMGWPYQLIDWQWYGNYNTPESDITTVNEAVDLPEVLAYAKKKGVKCWLWLYWSDVDNTDFEKACALYQEWGIAGIKIDFMARDDQEMVNWYHNIVKVAAKYQLMVDFHGAYKPTGIRRTYPNLMTREGVLGNEYNKWSLRVTPEHCLTLPFTRMLAGPMDFTPGGFRNRSGESYANELPSNVLGTRCFQLAEFVVFDSPYQVACDHPDQYKDQKGIEFLKEVKTVWDDTKVLNGQIGEYITMARRSGNDWFIGSMTNSFPRELEMRLDFLESGKYKMISFSDDTSPEVKATNLVKAETIVRKGDLVKIDMAAGGGFAAYLIPTK
jgi:alpha-glucosidase